MKFGKYLAARQLELPEYAGHFINYKALKKLINALAATDPSNQKNELSLQDKKGSFFFRLERELEKVNEFYLEKEAELKIRMDILTQKKTNALIEGRLENSKNSIAYTSLYDGFKKFSKDLDRLEQFVELNEIGFTKVLKKWDKRSKSKTKEVYLSTAVNVQPVFHRNEIIELSDMIANNLMELEAKAEGDVLVRYEKDDLRKKLNSSKSSIDDEKSVPLTNDRETDELHTEFVALATASTVPSFTTGVISPQSNKKLLDEWIQQVRQKTKNDLSAKISKIFLLSTSNPAISDDILKDFYTQFKQEINIKLVDDLSGRTCLHEASCFEDGTVRSFLVDICLEQGVDPLIKDISGRTCLHYAAEMGRDDILEKLIVNINSPELFDIMDNDSMTPLLLAILKNHVSSIKILVDHGVNAFPLQNDLKPLYLPLNVACRLGNVEVVKLLLSKAGSPDQITSSQLLTQSFQANAEGLLPLHIVASGGHCDLIPGLLQYGADINQLDKLNKWSPIFYCAKQGYPEATAKLIEHGADFDIKDEDGFTPLYYAIWEGNIDVVNVLNDAINKSKRESKAQKAAQKAAQGLQTEQFVAPPAPRMAFNDSIVSPILSLKDPLTPIPSSLGPALGPGLDMTNVDMIPDLSLPPPIIPLRKYGHNFLEKKIFLKLNFYTNRDSIRLHSDHFFSSVPGRLTITCDKNDLIPRNLLLPVLDSSKMITFQIDSFDDFAIDFELFPSFGTRLVAKATLLADSFSNVFPGVGSKLNGDVTLALFDVRLRNIGSLKFNYEIVYPYSGIPLEISIYDTYWKSTNNNKMISEGPNSNVTDNTVTLKSTYMSFVTASSLSGQYFKVHVCLLADCTPIVCPSWTVDIGHNTRLPVGNFLWSQLQSIVKDGTHSRQSPSLDQLVQALSQINNLSYESEKLETILQHLYLPLDQFLELLSIDISLDLDITYPSLFEMEYCGAQVYAPGFSFGATSHSENKKVPTTTNNKLNYFVDILLKNVFDHVRAIRNRKQEGATRSIIFSSNNSAVCTILNWKQPNYPVFYSLNGATLDSKLGKFKATTANGFDLDPTILEELENETCRSHTVHNHKNPTTTNTANIQHRLMNTHQSVTIDNIDSINKDSNSYGNEMVYQDRMTRSIKLAISFACSNNLLGIIVPSKLLQMCPELVKSIRSRGLILVASKTAFGVEEDISSESNESRDPDDMDEDDPFDEHDVNGLRFNRILSFKDAIDM
ncbi:unnamed protein product [Kuraishia capsulata CBS 1993]|uniref:SPX domain-containing protein n=1 Tax=Kuraishia capsulata CBS 1993 TaxID=1382522 RepID=W6MWI1_9ASCO|nr:uncharacterized protein KUCA_T00003463001 [Kuraishia capsulata CBS 1993]CDK27485.1 unnamed protein product [Kuraishia capsulata CBS 1993]